MGLPPCTVSGAAFIRPTLLTTSSVSTPGVLQSAGPEGAQRFPESLRRAHRHPARAGAAGPAGGREEAPQTVEGESRHNGNVASDGGRDHEGVGVQLQEKFRNSRKPPELLLPLKNELE